MSTRVTYKNVIKFRYSQRLWKGSDDQFYLADESADEEPWGHTADRGGGHKGRPNETDDGPLAIVRDEPIIVRWDKDYATTATVTCFSVKEDKWCSVGVTGDAALYLAANLGMTIKSTTGEYQVATFEDEGVLAS